MTYYNAYNIEKRQADLLLCLEYLKEPGRPTTVNRIKEDPSRSIIGGEGVGLGIDLGHPVDLHIYI